MRKHEWVAAGVMLAALMVTTAARAQTRCPAQARVEALERQGVAERTAHRDGAALALFQQAYELCHGARALARIGLAEKALGRWREAEEHLAAALEFRRDMFIGRNRAALTGELESVRDHLGELVLLGAGPTAEVWIGEERVGTWPTETPLRVAAGTVTVSVRATGYVTVTRTVQVIAREVARESITLAREAPPPEVRPVVPIASERVTPPSVRLPEARVLRVTVYEDGGAGRRLRALAWTSVALAAVALGAGVVATILREQGLDRWAANTPCRSAVLYPNDPRHAACEEELESADRAPLPWMFGGYAAAGAFALTAAALFITVSVSSPRQEPRVEVRCGVNFDPFGACAVRF